MMTLLCAALLAVPPLLRASEAPPSGDPGWLAKEREEIAGRMDDLTARVHELKRFQADYARRCLDPAFAQERGAFRSRLEAGVRELRTAVNHYEASRVNVDIVAGALALQSAMSGKPKSASAGLGNKDIASALTLLPTRMAFSGQVVGFYDKALAELKEDERLRAEAEEACRSGRNKMLGASAVLAAGALWAMLWRWSSVKGG